ncbi:MAG: S8/S53 family peptidase [Betaproteobacteria bacterium]
MSLLLKHINRFFRFGFVGFASLLAAMLFSACGGGGGDGLSMGGSPNTLVATQIAEVQPDNDTDTSSVFVQLGSVNTPTTGAQVVSDASREQLQNQFLTDLEAATKPKVLLGISTSAPCDLTGFTQQLENAHKFNTDAVVRLDLTACQLNFLKSLPLVKGVYPDIPLDHHAVTVPSSTAFNSLNNAMDFSFNSTASRQVNTTTMGSGSPKTVDGNGVVIAILDTGVEEKHPALGSAKVIPGACFSTASNGGASFCSNGKNEMIEPFENTDPNKRVARSCADASNSGSPVWSSKQLGISAGCAHGTAMASAAAMGVISASTSTANVSVKGGIAPQAQILPIQVFNKTGNALSASTGDLLAALEWVATEAERRKSKGQPPIVAANLSVGGGTYSKNCDSEYVGGLFKNVFEKLRTHGVLPIVAAGNSGNKTAISFPACASNAFSVAATQLDGLTVASYSNFSSQVKLFTTGGEYALPTLCSDGNNFDCWNTMAGTSQATAMVSGGVAALKSLKPSANLADIESALTSASGGSSKTVAINGIARPTLRLVSSGYKLMGVTEPPDPIPPSPNPTPNPAIATQGKVCFYPYVNYEGQARCASFNYGKWNNWYKITAKVGSVRVEPVNGSTPTTSTKVTFFHYAVDFNYSLRGVAKSEDIPDTSVLGFWDSGIPHIYGVRIQTP